MHAINEVILQNNSIKHAHIRLIIYMRAIKKKNQNEIVL